MNLPLVDGDMLTAAWMFGKVSLLLAAAALAHALLGRRTSAASRHLLWTLTVLCLLLLPVLSAVLPGWTAARLSRPTTPGAEPTQRSALRPSLQETDEAGASSAIAGSVPSPAVRTVADVPWSSVLPALYAAGVLVLLGRLLVEQLTIRRLARGATEVNDGEWSRLLRECAERIGVRRPVRLLRCREHTMPMTFGTRRPAVLIPAAADAWGEDRRRAVLLHELAHIGRYDCLTQMSAAAACALYWVHPGVWWIARRLRVERELACDDRVVTIGTHAREYAGHLLELAYTLSSGRAPALTVSMARPGQLEGRLLAVLDAARNRATPAPRRRLAGMAAAIALLVPLAGAQARVILPDAISAHPPGDAAVAPALLSSSLEPAQTPPASAPGVSGTWEIRPTREAGTVQLRLNEGDGSFGSTIRIERLEGLLPAQLADAGGLVRFAIRRDAGTFAFDGVFRNGIGAGTFAFTPNASFPADLAKRGLERPTPADQYTLARADIGFAFLDELTAQGYQRPDLPQLVRAAQHGVHLDYLKEMGALGYRLRLVEALIAQRDHGVSPQFIRELREEGLQLSADDLVRARAHGVSPEYVRELRTAGYRNLSLDTLMQLRDHGVSPAYVRDLAALGYRNLTLDTLIQLRDHGVSPEYARELRALGYPELPLDTLIRLREHGVSPEYARDLRALGYQNLTLDALIRLREHGVSPEYVRELKALGYDGLAEGDLVGLREHGVTADRVRSANARAGRRLTIDMLKAAALNGWR